MVCSHHPKCIFHDLNRIFAKMHQNSVEECVTVFPPKGGVLRETLICCCELLTRNKLNWSLKRYLRLGGA